MTKKPPTTPVMTYSTGNDRVFTKDRSFTRVQADPKIKIQAVVRALENPKYKWRTLGGIIREAGVTRMEAETILDGLGDKIVRSSVPSVRGEPLFTTRQYYKKSESILSRFTAILRNRAT